MRCDSFIIPSMNDTHYDFTQPIILGLGKTGLSFARYLIRHKIKNFTVLDSRNNPPGQKELRSFAPDAKLHCGAWDSDSLKHASVILASPGVDIRFLKYQNIKAPVIGDIELFACEARAPIVAVTGTNGKSSVVSLLAQMAHNAGVPAALVGNIGAPVLDVLESDVPDYYIVELSSFQLETTNHLNAFIAVVLNAAEDHMDRYDHVDDYIKAKLRIYQGVQHALINRDAPHCWEGVVDPKSADSFSYQNDADEPLLTAALLTTKHQKENALAAIAMGRRMGLPCSAMQKALADFKGLAHRCQCVAERHGVLWYNDSKATNVSSAMAAIESLAASCRGQLIWIAGGLGKNQGFSPLIPRVSTHVDHAIFLGEDAKMMQALFSPHTDVTVVQALGEAVTLAKSLAKPGDIVLFSPACASFDMFDNFEHRGTVFENLVSTNV
jgi:UDP-N-acetylmuramoylalanine--D-glutamate ligase